MKKVILVALVAAVALAIILVGCSSSPQTSTSQPATSQQATSPAVAAPIELKLSFWPPPSDNYSNKGIIAWGQSVEKATNGKVKFTFFGGATLGAPPDHLDLVKKDTADIGWVNPAFTPNVFPLTDIRNLPFLYPSVQVASKVFWRQQEILNPIEYKDVKVLWTFPTPVMELQMAKKQVKTLEELKGMKFGETEPQAAKTDTFLGIIPVVMQETEIYTSLQTGLLDGRFQEYQGLVTWKTMEVTNYRTENVRIFVHQNAMIMNLQKYNSLPADVKKVIDDTTGMVASSQAGDIWAQGETDSRNQVLAYDKAKGNPAPYVLPDSERAKFITAAQPAIDSWLKDMEGKGQGAVAKDLLDKTKQWVTEYSK